MSIRNISNFTKSVVCGKIKRIFYKSFSLSFKKTKRFIPNFLLLLLNMCPLKLKIRSTEADVAGTPSTFWLVLKEEAN
jgi:hypothetical protein